VKREAVGELERRSEGERREREEMSKEEALWWRSWWWFWRRWRLNFVEKRWRRRRNIRRTGSIINKGLLRERLLRKIIFYIDTDYDRLEFN
jgi:hypothetical protein